jgi:hypothetical protein
LEVRSNVIWSQSIRRNGGASTMFFVYFFEDDRTLEFLQKAGLFRSVTPCPQCGRNVTLGKNRQSNLKFYWRCKNSSGSGRCTGTRNVRHCSWCTRSKITLGQVTLLAYDIITIPKYRKGVRSEITPSV